MKTRNRANGEALPLDLSDLKPKDTDTPSILQGKLDAVRRLELEHTLLGVIDDQRRMLSELVALERRRVESNEAIERLRIESDERLAMLRLSSEERLEHSRLEVQREVEERRCQAMGECFQAIQAIFGGRSAPVVSTSPPSETNGVSHGTNGVASREPGRA